MRSKKTSFMNVMKIIGKILSWALFVILLIAAAFLIYYYIATKIYATKGAGYEPKFSIYTIVSPSMTPNINVYDAIINERVDSPNDIAVGDVITFVSTSLLTPGTTITHRVIGITKDEKGDICYQTKGDFNDVADQACAKYSNLIGKVIFRIPQLGRLQFFLASKAGWILCILIPAIFIIGRDIMRIVTLSNIKDTTNKLEKKKSGKDPKKEKMEEERKKELKRRLLKEETKQDYFDEPKINVVDKRNKKRKDD